MKADSGILRNCMALLVLTGALSGGVARAQTADDVKPSSTTATYNDWLLRCREIGPAKEASAAKAKRVCEMVHVIRVAVPVPQNTAAGKTAPRRSQVFGQIAVGRLPGSKVTKMVFQVPGGVWLREPVKLKMADNQDTLEDAAGDNLQTATYFRCQNNTCLADLEFTDAAAGAMQAAKVVQFSFVDKAKRTFNVPVSLNGFAAAYQALDGELEEEQ